MKFSYILCPEFRLFFLDIHKIFSEIHLYFYDINEFLESDHLYSGRKQFLIFH